MAGGRKAGSYAAVHETGQNRASPGSRTASKPVGYSGLTSSKILLTVSSSSELERGLQLWEQTSSYASMHHVS